MPHPPAPIRRRVFLPLVGAALAAPALLARPARAAAPATPAQLAAWESPRTLGHPDAKIVVEEFFSPPAPIARISPAPPSPKSRRS